MLAGKTQTQGDFDAAISLLRHAVHVDPKFALDYRGLGVVYLNLGQGSLANENL
jgi:Flp pilus assembly protein TadD